jgi:hypothetical protein
MTFSVGQAPSQKTYLENLAAKITELELRQDAVPILRMGSKYNIDIAFESFKSTFIALMQRHELFELIKVYYYVI